MALIVETGQGGSDSESYISVADASTFHTNRGNTAWAALASDTVREQCLRRATEYMIAEYRLRWKGVRGSTTQALDWPRGLVERPDYSYTGSNGYTTISGDYYFPADEVPVEVQRACAELALKASVSALAPDVGRVTTREKVDVIEIEYAVGSVPYVRYRAIDNMLAPFLNGRAGAVTVVRT